MTIWIIEKDLYGNVVREQDFALHQHFPLISFPKIQTDV